MQERVEVRAVLYTTPPEGSRSLIKCANIITTQVLIGKGQCLTDRPFLDVIIIPGEDVAEGSSRSPAGRVELYWLSEPFGSGCQMANRG